MTKPVHCEDRACPTCPYARATPPGIWHRTEYEKLRAYDLETWAQPPALFMCHQRTGALCAGWIAVHGWELLALRLAGEGLRLPLPVVAGDFYASGNEAADAGLAGVRRPSGKAQKAARKIVRNRRRRR
jgi:hypothetical protein